MNKFVKVYTYSKNYTIWLQNTPKKSFQLASILSLLKLSSCNIYLELQKENSIRHKGVGESKCRWITYKKKQRERGAQCVRIWFQI